MNINYQNVNEFVSPGGYHPTLFESSSNNKQSNFNTRTLENIIKERSAGLISTSFSTELESPGTFSLTPKENGGQSKNPLKRGFGENLLSKMFFSEKNITQLQNNIKYNVNKFTNQIIDNQSDKELIIIMRYIFLQFANHTVEYNLNFSPEQKRSYLRQNQNEVLKLNQKVLEEILPKIVSQLQQYTDYLRDISQPYGGNNLENKPLATSIKGEKVYRSATSVLLGGTF